MHSKPLSPWIFNLDGSFLGIVEDDVSRDKYILLEVDEEQLPIKYPTQLCDRLNRQLQPGDRIQCVGRSQLDFLSKAIKLEAYQVWSLTAPSYTQPLVARPA